MAEKNLYANIRNVRDLGGMRTIDGRAIRYGKLIRSNNISDLSEPFRSELLQTVDTVVDLRDPMEYKERPQYITEGVQTISLPLLEKNIPGISRRELLDKIVICSYLFRPEAAKKYMIRMYSVMIEQEYSIRQLEKFIRILLEPHEKAVLWHCSAGKDRAGLAAMITEELLGIPRETIFEDYLRSDENLRPDIDDKKKQVTKRFPFARKAPQTMEYLFGVEKEFLESAYKKIDQRYGGFEPFVSDGLHISKEEIETLKERYLTK